MTIMFNIDNCEKMQEGCLEWKIFAYSGTSNYFSLKETVRHLYTNNGWTLDKDESARIVVEHPPYDSPVEITFAGGITQNGMRYALCFKSISLGFRNKHARIHKNLYDLTISLIPWKWRKEVYWIEDGKDILVYKTVRPLRLKRRRKK
jgi:hypothetical protein